MNSVALIGRLTRDPETRTMTDGTAICKFSIAIDRMKEGTDFPNIVCFGKTAENVQRYIGKGRLVGVTGRLQTGSYTKDDGTKVYTTDVVANNVQFLDRAPEQDNQGFNQGFNQPNQFNQQPNQFNQQQNQQPNQFNQGFNQPNQFNQQQNQFNQNQFQSQQGFNQQNQQQQTTANGFGFEEIESDIPF